MKSCADLALGNWVSVTNSVTVNGGSNTVAIQMVGTAKFFRLAR